MKMETTKLEMIIEAKKLVKELAKETKTLWQNDAYNVCLLETSDGDIKITKIQVGWNTKNPHVVIGNSPMTKKEVIETLDFQESEIKRYQNQRDVDYDA